MFRRTCSALPLFVLATLPFAVHAQKFAPSGKFEVTSSGAAQFTAPIKVTPGTAGLQPELAFVYNSQRKADWQGPNWTLSGVSMITRCPKTMAQDGVREDYKFLYSDAYCLDGQRLIPVSGVNGRDGTEYRLESDNITRVTSLGRTNFLAYNTDGTITYRKYDGGPASFKVQTKSGLVMEFDDSDRFAITNTSLPKWLLKKVSDRMGNYMRYTWQNTNPSPSTDTDLGWYRPVRIDYTGNDITGLVPTEYVTIVWQNSGVQYHNGVASMAAVPLSVSSYSGKTATYIGKLITRTGFTEGSWSSTTPMNSLTECNDIGNMYCLSAIKFTYEPNLPQFNFWTSDSAFPGTKADYQHFFADLNGDGRKYWIQISQASDEAWLGLAKPDASFTAANWSKLPQSIGALNGYNHYFADVNGDGKADWVRISRTTNEMWVALGVGNGNFQFWSKYSTAIGAGSSNKHFFADINGDGMADLIQVGNTNDTLNVAVANGDGSFQFWGTSKTLDKLSQWEHTFADINGDGKADWLASYSEALYSTTPAPGQLGSFRIFNNDGTVSEAGSLPLDSTGVRFPVGTKYSLADLNGDGQADALATRPDGSAEYALSKGDGKTTPFINALNAMWQPLGNTVLTGDIGGAGFASLIIMSNDYVSGAMRYAKGGDINLSDVLSFNATIDQINQIGYVSPNSYKYFLADLNGDGKADLIVINNKTQKAMVAASQFNTSPKMIAFGSDGGTPTQITYKPLSDSSVVTPGNTAVYPMRNSPYPLSGRPVAPFVVANVSTPNGIGGTLNTSYTYGGLRINLNRERPEGFAWVNSLQQETGISAKSTYLQDFPYTGLVAQSSKNIVAGGNNGLLSQTTYSYGCTDYVQTSGCLVAIGKRYNVFTNQVTSINWDLNGASLPGSTGSFQYDAYNNPTQVINSTTGGYSTTTVTSYNNNIANWWIGMPVRSTVTKVTP